MRSITLAILMTAAVTPLAAIQAQAFEAKCLLQVDGKKYLDRRCNAEVDPDGSFRIGVDEKASPYFAYVNVLEDDRNKAEASWNKDPKSTHAHSDLGTVSYERESQCWINEHAKICWSNN